MRINSLTLWGFTSYKKRVTLDFSDLSVFVITGPNGAGKSSLVESILFSLYGKSPRTEKGISHLISQDVTEMGVDLEFYIEDHLYRVLRIYKKNAKGKVSPSVVELRKWENDKWKIVASKSRDVTKKIEEILGMDYQTFTRAVIIPQNMFDKFLKPDTERERRDILITLLGLTIYEKIREFAKEEKAKLEQEIARIEGRWDHVKDVTEEIVEELNKKIKILHIELSDIQREYDYLARDRENLRRLREIQKDLERTKRERDDLLLQKEKIQKLKEEIEKAKVVREFSEKYKSIERLRKDYEKRRSIFIKDKETLENIKTELNILLEKEKNYINIYKTSSVKDILDVFEEKRDKILGVLEKLNSIKEIYDEFGKLKKEINLLKVDLVKRGKLFKRRYDEYGKVYIEYEKAREKEIEYYAARISMTLHSGDQCPVCGGIYKKESKGKVVSFDRDIDLLREEMQKLSLTLERMKGEIRSLGLTINEKKIQKKKAKESLSKFKIYLYKSLNIDITGLDWKKVESILKKEKVEVESILKNIRNLEEDISNIQDKKKILEEKVKESKSFYEEIRDLFEKEKAEFENMLSKRGYNNFDNMKEFILSDEEIEKREKICSEYEKRLFALNKKLEDLSFSIKEEDRIKERLDEVELKIKTVTEDIKRLTSLKATLEEKLKGTMKDLEEKVKLEGRIREVQERLSIYNTILYDLQSDRLPEYILATVMDTLFERASGNLQTLTYGRYMLQLDEDDNIVVIDTWNGGERRSVDTLSGGEIFATSLALAISLRDLVQGKGMLDTFFIDEGFGALDKETRERVVEILGSLSEMGKLVGIITHVEELAMNFPVGFKIYKSPEGSYVEVINPISK